MIEIRDPDDDQFLIFKCTKCGYIPEGKKEGNWVRYENKPCPKCGGKTKMEMKEDKS